MIFWNIDTIYCGNKIWLDTVYYSQPHQRSGELKKSYDTICGGLAFKVRLKTSGINLQFCTQYQNSRLRLLVRNSINGKKRGISIIFLDQFNRFDFSNITFYIFVRKMLSVTECS